MRIFASCFYISSLERYFVPSFHLQLLALNDRQQYLLFNCSLYQQQHALARHEAGDQPTEGVRIELENLSRHSYSLYGLCHHYIAHFCLQVRTAPTPSQPPTPFAEGGKPLPGEQVREIREEKEQHPEEKMPVTEDQLCEDTEEKLKVTEKDEEPAQTEREEKVAEEAQGPVPDLVPQGEQQQQENGGETDSLKVSRQLLSYEGAEMPGPQIFQPRQPWLGAHSCLRHI